ncbi:G-protein beta WD-40 repeats containing protein, partial [Reticulomyxa filosa]
EKVCQLQLENSMLKPNIEANEKKDILNIPSENVALKQQQDIPKPNDEQKAIPAGLEAMQQVKDNEIEKQQIADDEKKQDNNNYTYPAINFDMFYSASKLLNTFIGHICYVNNIDYSTFDGGQFICFGSYDTKVHVWEVGTNEQVQLFEEHSDRVSCVKFSPYHYYNYHRHIICSSSYDKTFRFWDIKDNRQLKIFREHKRWISGIEFSSFNGGRYLCSGSGDKTIRLCDVGTSKLLHIFNGHESDICCLDISPLQSNSNNNHIGVIGGNGYTICSGSNDKTIRVWDIETAKQLTLFKGHKKFVNSVKYGSNESANIILSGSTDKSVRLWDIRSNAQIQTFNGHTKNVTCAEYSPFVVNNKEASASSNVICSGSHDRTIRFWDIRSNKNALHMIKEEKIEDNGITCLKFVPVKKKEKNCGCNFNLYYGSANGYIRIWG